jgi:hypothetical protein
MEDYKNKLGNLANKLKQEKPNIPLQQVQPVKSELIVKVVEVQFNNWVPKALLKRVKAYGLEYDLSLKEINIKALELFLHNNSKTIQT